MADPATSTAVPVNDGEPAAPVSDLVPKWLENLAALGWRVFVIAALLVVLWLLVSVLWVVTASIVVAIVIAAFFAPYALRLRARGRSRTAAAAIVWVVALAIVGGALLLLGLAMLPYVVELLRDLDAGRAAAPGRHRRAEPPADRRHRGP